MVESSFLKFQHAGKAKPMDEACQVVAEFIRVLKEQVEQMVKVKLNLENNICHWMVRWAAKMCSKYMVGKRWENILSSAGGERNATGAEKKPKVIDTDNSLEFGKAREDLSWNHCTLTPHRSETNGIAERAVRRVKEGTSAVLLQSGLNESWWADSMECCICLRNVTDLLSDGKTPYDRRFGQPFEGPIIPFGSLVECHPVTAKDQSRIHQFGKKVLPGLYLGHALYAEGIWKGDVLVADLEELETMDALEIYSKRLNAKQVIFPKENGNFIFPITDGPIKLPGGDQGLITSAFDTGTSNSRRKSRRFSWRIRRVSSTTSRLTSGCW